MATEEQYANEDKEDAHKRSLLCLIGSESKPKAKSKEESKKKAKK